MCFLSLECCCGRQVPCPCPRRYFLIISSHFSGGGDKGAYAAGAIKGLALALPLEEHSWDVVSGISIGAMNAFQLSLFPVGEEETAADFLYHFWSGIRKKDLYQSWPGGIREAFTHPHSGIFDDNVFYEYFNKYMLEKKLGRILAVGAVDVNSGRYVRFNSSVLSYEEMVNTTRGSGSFPVAFESVHF